MKLLTKEAESTETKLNSQLKAHRRVEPKTSEDDIKGRKLAQSDASSLRLIFTAVHSLELHMMAALNK